MLKNYRNIKMDNSIIPMDQRIGKIFVNGEKIDCDSVASKI